MAKEWSLFVQELPWHFLLWLSLFLLHVIHGRRKLCQQWEVFYETENPRCVQFATNDKISYLETFIFSVCCFNVFCSFTADKKVGRT